MRPLPNPIAAAPGAARVAPTIGCMLALALILTASPLYNHYVVLVSETLFGPVQAVDPALAAAAYAALAAVSYFRPAALVCTKARAAAAASVAASAVLVALARQTGSAPALVAGMALYALVYAWLNLLLACCLAALPSLRSASVAVVGGIIVRQLAYPLYALPMGPLAATVAVASLCVVAGAVLCVVGGPFFRQFADGRSLDQLALTNPLSSLRPPLPFFVAVFLVSLTYSFSCQFGVPGAGTLRFAVVFLLFALLYMLLIQREGQEDRLFSLAVALIMAGLLAMPVAAGLDSYVPNTLLFVGSNCFTILICLLMYSLGRRNVFAMLPVCGAAGCLDALGKLGGGALGDAFFSMFDVHVRNGQALVLGVALFFFACAWFGFRRFDFTAAIRAVERVDEMEGAPAEGGSSLPDGPRSPGRWEDRCGGLADAAALTPREREVFDLLVRGRNARYIMETLDITRNTAKAHIAHVYAKLGVHSHQELLSLVEGDGDGPDGRAPGA